MKRITLSAGILLASNLLWVAGVASENAQTALLPTVELIVRAPNGRPVANTDITLFSGDEHVAAKTDATGLVRFQWPHPAPIFVRVPSVGYGATGLFPLRAGKTVRVPLPRLAPFGVIEGTVPAELRKPGLVVSIYSSTVENWWQWLQCEAAVDDSGHFIFKDVPAGSCCLVARIKGKKHPLASATVSVDPGERVRQVTMVETSPLFDPEPTPQQPDENKPAPDEKEPKPVPWAEGTVRDEVGRPLEGAQVFASVLEQGGNEYSDSGAAITDSHGHWQIAGPPWYFVVKAQLLVCKFGYCSAVVPIRIPELADVSQISVGMADSKPRPTLPLKPQVLDVALSDHCGGMEVLVTRDGEPLADATVSISEDAPEELVLGAASESVAWEEAAQRVLHPVSVTGEDGIARFNGLTPGKYAILIDDGLPDLRFAWQFWERGLDGRLTAPGPAYHGIVVESGKVRRFHARVAVADYSVALRVTNPDGKAAAGLTTGWWVGRRETETCSANGLVVNHYDRPGLKEIACTYVEEKSTLSPYGKTEYFESYREIKSTVAASELLRPDSQVSITSIASENVPGSLVVQLLDSAGKPAAGIVKAGQQTASTDEKGEVRFEGVPPKVDVGAVLPGMKLPQFEQWTPPLPSDKELVGHWQFGGQIECPLDVETRFVVRPGPVGYIRGVVHAAAGRNIESYFIENASVPKSGEFLVGPFPVGTKNLALNYSTPVRFEQCDCKDVEVRSDRVAHVDFDQTKSPLGLPGQTKGCDGEYLSSDVDVDVEAAVFLPDGRTPASGAQVALLVANGVGALRQGATDARCRCSIAAFPARFSWTAPDLETKHDQVPNEPTFVAWIPGRFGTAIALAKSADDKGKLRIVLPPSTAQRGKITIGGKEFAEQRGQLRVMAGREGTTRLNSLFSQYVSADPEGNFELPALAPGVYQVQAALDDIWLSESVRIVVSADAASLKPIVLNIGEPGPASTVAVVDGHGKPSPDVKVAVVRPSGPLASLLWSHAFATDGAGVAQIPPLEAGQHIVRISGIPGESRLDVPPLSDHKAPPGTLRATISGPPSH